MSAVSSSDAEATASAAADRAVARAVGGCAAHSRWTARAVSAAEATSAAVVAGTSTTRSPGRVGLLLRTGASVTVSSWWISVLVLGGSRLLSPSRCHLRRRSVVLDGPVASAAQREHHQAGREETDREEHRRGLEA